MELVAIIALAFYGAGAWKFWTGFNRTDFSTGKVYLTLLWPAFMVSSKAYRHNFTRALKGR